LWVGSENMKVTLVTSGWPPSFGGADTHPYRLLDKLRKEGLEVKAIVGMDIDKTKWNGDYGEEVVKIIITSTRKIKDFPEQTDSEIKEWLDLVKRQLIYDKPDIIILFNQFIRASQEWVEEIQLLGIKVVTLIWDIDSKINIIVEGMKEYEWLDSPYRPEDNFQENLHKINRHHLTQQYQEGELPFARQSLAEIADGVIHITQHNMDTYNYITEYTPHAIVVHPFLDFDEWLKEPNQSIFSEQFTIGVVNCNLHKGQTIIRQCLLQYPNHFFRVLIGGWGGGEWMFNVMERFYNYDGKNSEQLSYVDDMRNFYDTIDVLLFPTFSEGYGQVVLEAACRGIPTVTKDNPALHESGGTGAFYMGKKDYPSADLWMDKIDAIQDEYLTAQMNAYEWALEAQERQAFELKKLTEFLSDILQ